MMFGSFSCNSPLRRRIVPIISNGSFGSISRTFVQPAIVTAQKENFDIVLVDAPCSSSGTWRRNPDLRWHHYGPAHESIERVQGEILETVAARVKPGGRLVYATCSLFTEENERQVEIFLAAHPEFVLRPAPEAWQDAGLQTPCPVDGPYLRLSPHEHKTDGFFAAVMIKNTQGEQDCGSD